MKNTRHIQEHVRAVTQATRVTIGSAANTAGKVALAALFGNSAGDNLALVAHNPLLDLEQMRDQTDSVAASRMQVCSIPDSEVVKLFRATGTAVWKLEQRMFDAETKEPKDEFRRLWRHVEAIKDALSDIGVDIVDWTNKRYDEGMSLKVVSEEERPGTKEPEIVETLLPTIRFRKQIQLQQGEVVVSKPTSGTQP